MTKLKEEPRRCPYCSSIHLTKRGTTTDRRQKWECKDCGAIVSQFFDEKRQKEVDIMVTKVIRNKVIGEQNDKI